MNPTPDRATRSCKQQSTYRACRASRRIRSGGNGAAVCDLVAQRSHLACREGGTVPAPPRWLQQMLQGLGPRSGAPGVAQHRHPLVKRDAQRIVGVDVLGQPVATGASSGSKVPKNVSQTMRMPAWLRSRYSTLAPWWTRWCDGVLRIHSSGPRRSISSVWIQNW